MTTEAEYWRRCLEAVPGTFADVLERADTPPGLRALLARAQTHLGPALARTVGEAFDESSVAGMLWLDVPAAELLASLGRVGQTQADGMLEMGRKRWQRRNNAECPIWLSWQAGDDGALFGFARRLERVLADLPPAPEPAAAPGLTPGPRAPTLAVPIAEALLRALGPNGKAPLAGSIDAHRLLWWLVNTQARSSGAAPMSLHALGEAIGGSGRTRRSLPALVDALGGVGPLRGLAVVDIERHPAGLVMCPGPALLPPAVLQFPVGQQRRVPLLPLPPLDGRRTTHGAQANLQLALLLHLRRHAAELVRAGGVAISDAQWDRLAAEAGLFDAKRRQTVGAWIHAGLLVEPQPRVFSLGQACSSAVDAILAGGRSDIGRLAGAAEAPKAKAATAVPSRARV